MAECLGCRTGETYRECGKWVSGCKHKVDSKAHSPTERNKVDFWTRTGVIIAALSAIVTYLGVAAGIHWPPFSNPANAAAEPRVEMPYAISYCNNLRVIGAVSQGQVLLLFDRLVDVSNSPVDKHNYDFDRAATFTVRGWMFRNVEIGSGTSSDAGDHHEIALTLLDKKNYEAFSSGSELNLAVLPGKTVQQAYVIRNSDYRPCP